MPLHSDDIFVRDPGSVSLEGPAKVRDVVTRSYPLTKLIYEDLNVFSETFCSIDSIGVLISEGTGDASPAVSEDVTVVLSAAGKLFFDTITTTDGGDFDFRSPIRVRDSITAQMGALGNVSKTETFTVTDVVILDSAPLELLTYDSIGISDGGSNNRVNPVKIREFVLVDLARRLTLEVGQAVECLISEAFLHTWDNIRKSLSDTIYIYDDVGQSNAIAVREYVVVNFSSVDRERAVYDAILVSESVSTSVYDFDLSSSLSDSVSSTDVVFREGADLTRELNDALTALDSLSRRYDPWQENNPNSVAVTDYAIGFLRLAVIPKSIINAITVTDSVTPRYSKLTVSVYDTIGVGSDPYFQDNDEAWLYFWRYRT